MKYPSVFTPALFLLLTLGGVALSAQDRQKPRLVVTTDPEPDDANSLIRYLPYSTDFRTEGLIYASSGFHWKGRERHRVEVVDDDPVARGLRVLGAEVPAQRAAL